MWKSLQMMWHRFVNQPEEAAQPIRITLRDKAVAVAERVTVFKDGESWKSSCPVCFEGICGSSECDMRKTLAVHLSLWHHDDVQLQWERLHKKKEVVHLPSIVAGVGLAAGLAIMMIAFASRNQATSPAVAGRQPIFKSR